MMVCFEIYVRYSSNFYLETAIRNQIYAKATLIFGWEEHVTIYLETARESQCLGGRKLERERERERWRGDIHTYKHTFDCKYLSLHCKRQNTPEVACSPLISF